jgi:hypothetical protein
MAVELLIDALPWWFTEEQLRSLFQPYGSVSAVSIVRAPHGQSLGLAMSPWRQLRMRARRAGPCAIASSPAGRSSSS